MKMKHGLVKNAKAVWVVLIALIVIAVGLGVFFMRGNISAIGGDNNARTAVFLTNGQVYFGFMSDQNEQYITLSNIFYIKSTDTSSDTNKLTLVKLGSEVYGPEDSMKINRDHVLYLEKMKEHSKIADAIIKAAN